MANKLNKAVFLDRDGVINRMVVLEDGRVDTPMTPAQFEMVRDAAPALQKLQGRGFMIIIVSNQPNVGRGSVPMRRFNAMGRKMKAELARHGVHVDDEYYCFHSADAKKKEFRMKCSCRKPEPGMLLEAIKKHRIDPGRSYMVGDSLTDVEAGRRAGVRTALVCHVSSLLTEIMSQKSLYPDMLVESLTEAALKIIEGDSITAGGDL